MRPLNVNYDGTGWNADYISTLTEDDFVGQFAATKYGHLPDVKDRVKAAQAAYRYIMGQYRIINPHVIEKPTALPDEE